MMRQVSGACHTGPSATGLAWSNHLNVPEFHHMASGLDPVTGSSKFPDLAVGGLGEIEGPQVLTFHTVSPEHQGQTSR